VVRRVFKGSERQRKMYAHESLDDAANAPATPKEGAHD